MSLIDCAGLCSMTDDCKGFQMTKEEKKCRILKSTQPSYVKFMTQNKGSKDVYFPTSLLEEDHCKINGAQSAMSMREVQGDFDQCKKECGGDPSEFKQSFSTQVSNIFGLS